MKKLSSTPGKSTFSLSALSRTRGQLYGVMTFLIFFCHTFVRYDLLLKNATVLYVGIEHLRHIAVSAVDMFLIMSGVSLYFSYSADPRTKEFYKKRAMRILPPMLFVSAIWFALISKGGAADYLRSVFFITFFTEGNRNFWFFVFLLFCYLIYPLLHKLFSKTGIYGLIACVALSVACNFLLMNFCSDFYNNIEVALIRIPSFLFGCWLGKYVKEEKSISCKWLFVAVFVYLVTFVAAFINNSATETIFYYMCFPLAISSLMLLSALFSRFALKTLTVILTWLGGYSLEFYLLYEKVRDLARPTIGTTDETLLILYSFAFFVTIALAVGLKHLCNIFNEKIFKKLS
ncbi:MAG: acyltransferase [Ruminococcus sp.]|nr:acyltransferase [Ruminococcus sp.]